MSTFSDLRQEKLSSNCIKGAGCSWLRSLTATGARSSCCSACHSVRRSWRRAMRLAAYVAWTPHSTPHNDKGRSKPERWMHYRVSIMQAANPIPATTAKITEITSTETVAREPMPWRTATVSRLGWSTSRLGWSTGLQSSSTVQLPPSFCSIFWGVGNRAIRTSLAGVPIDMTVILSC